MLRTPLLLLLRGYQRAISPLLGMRCRFYPSCSQYALEAIERHGAARGSYMAVCRLARCHPGCEGGHDPVPLAFTWKPWVRSSGRDSSRPDR
ncbi:MAG: membrane protein insertion efficiency factor YidD [Xanthomonadales bacterium PRO6]|nr:membrane protein insertion efficiency factor YidD [Xanthomonadales bacterium PRO6]